jgi:hypothetical protein
MQSTIETMKQIILTLAALATVQLATAQERLPREEALKYAAAVTADARQLEGAPIATDPDAKQPVALREGEYGGLVLPQKNLSAESLKATQTIAPVGLLWLHNLAPMKYGQAIAPDKLRLVTVYADGGYATVPQCALGVRGTSDGGLEMLVFGKNPEPLLAVPLKPITATQELPLELAAEREYDSGRITVKILGKYQATFAVTELIL